jgi:virginiamycin B lyase
VTSSRTAFARLSDVEVVLHTIPTPDSGPYIVAPGPDGGLWFCESDASQIGRFDPANGVFVEFPTPTPDARPIGNLWFCENAAN